MGQGVKQSDCKYNSIVEPYWPIWILDIIYLLDPGKNGENLADNISNKIPCMKTFEFWVKCPRIEEYNWWYDSADSGSRWLRW